MAPRKIKIYKGTFISKHSSISVSYKGKATVILSRVVSLHGLPSPLSWVELIA